MRPTANMTAAGARDSQATRDCGRARLMVWLLAFRSAEKDVMVLHLVGGPRTLVAAFLETCDGLLNLLGSLLGLHSSKDDRVLCLEVRCHHVLRQTLIRQLVEPNLALRPLGPLPLNWEVLRGQNTFCRAGIADCFRRHRSDFGTRREAHKEQCGLPRFVWRL